MPVLRLLHVRVRVRVRVRAGVGMSCRPLIAFTRSCPTTRTSSELARVRILLGAQPWIRVRARARVRVRREYGSHELSWDRTQG